MPDYCKREDQRIKDTYNLCSPTCNGKWAKCIADPSSEPQCSDGHYQYVKNPPPPPHPPLLSMV